MRPIIASGLIIISIGVSSFGLINLIAIMLSAAFMNDQARRWLRREEGLSWFSIRKQHGGLLE